jgi:hypothetical protein
MTVFWDMTPCSLTEVDHLMMEAVCASEASVYFTRLHDAISEKAVTFILPLW